MPEINTYIFNFLMERLMEVNGILFSKRIMLDMKKFLLSLSLSFSRGVVSLSSLFSSLLSLSFYVSPLLVWNSGLPLLDKTMMSDFHE